MTDSASVAWAVLDGLRDAGVTDVVVCPGSRSAPLSMAAYDASVRGGLRLHVRVDERTAGFLALGLGKSARRAVAVVTTSGTAVANLHPAVLEARHSGIALIVLSADRPAWMRGTGANQTTEQHALFGPSVSAVDIAPGDSPGAMAAIEAAVRRPGPTQVNLQFAEPLVSTSKMAASVVDRTETRSVSGLDELGHDGSTVSSADDLDQPRWPGSVLPLGPRTVVVAGDDAGPPARLLAERANWPLLAEPTSGARTGTNALRTYRLLLQSALADQVQRVVVTGHPTLSRPVTSLITRPEVEVVSVRGRAGIHTDPARLAQHLDTMPAVGDSDDPTWLGVWRAADEKVSAAVDELVRSHPDGLPLRVAAAVADAVVPQALLVVGSSQPIRDLDLMGRPNPVGERRFVVGNRGLSGIDGMVSTAVGAALGRPSTRSLAYVGDITFVHDANGLVLGSAEPRPDLTFVVANDNGGAIFSTLEQGDPVHARSFERVFGTPHGVDLQALCAATGTTYERVADDDALRELLATEPSGIRVLEVSVPRRGRRALEADLGALATSYR